MDSIIAQRVEELRNWLIQQQFDALIIPHEDEYLGEYLPPQNQRLKWATGFAGSAGAAIITQNSAAIFVDGRYTVQVRKQVPAELFEYRHLTEQPMLDWLNSHLPENSTVGYDPKLHSASWLVEARDTLSDRLALTAITDNPIDQLWLDRPQPICSPLLLMTEEMVGKTSAQKRHAISISLTASSTDAVVLTQLDSICWLLNIRGLDVPRLPVILCQAILHSDASLELFFAPERLPDGFHQHVGAGVSVTSPDLFSQSLRKLASKSVLIDPAHSNAWLTLQLEDINASVLEGPDPCLMSKAIKNEAEIRGMRACHVRDGVAMVRFLTWLDAQVAQKNYFDEDQLAQELAQCRQLDPTLKDLSFDTISAAGSNAAMCHYQHTDQSTYGTISDGTLYLVDSGGQYLDGTTDITRTITIGEVDPFARQQFTLVLKGHIAIATARFPEGTCGYQLDPLARQFLWAHGYNYDHGTGHGVGHFLSVHEGPARIGPLYNDVALQPGMVLSNEPGYYRAECFGIRIENLELVVDKAVTGDKPVFGFEPLTRCPIDVRAIDINLLTDPELTWLNHYHELVYKDISPLIEGDELRWLSDATAPLTR